MADFPRTMVGGLSLPRMLIGSNWMLGYSHKTVSYDSHIKQMNRNSDRIAELCENFLEYNIDAYMAPISDNPEVLDGLKKAEDRTGKRIIRIDTPILNVDDSKEARQEAEAAIKRAKAAGVDFLLPHHACVEQMVNKNLKAIPRLPDYLKMIRDNDMIPGLSAHMPECIVFSDMNEYDVETYIQIYNCMGFLMQVEIEYIHSVIWNAKKPVMTIKAMAAGRVTPLVGLTYSYATIRPCDMVTVGCLTADEIHEDVEISMAAIERRRPILEGRSSPAKTAIVGKDQP